MKLLFDLFPVILFFLVFKLAGSFPAESLAIASSTLGGLVAGGQLSAEQAPILLAPATAIVATFVQVGWLLARGRKVEPMLWLSVAVIVIFGGATIWLHDETFIKWKPTILYWLFGTILLAGRLGWRRNFIRQLLGPQISLPDAAWDKLLWAWIGFFLFAGAFNLFVAFNFPTDTWVNFKLFGTLGLTLAFVVGQAFYVGRFVQEEG